MDHPMRILCGVTTSLVTGALSRVVLCRLLPDMMHHDIPIHKLMPISLNLSQSWEGWAHN